MRRNLKLYLFLLFFVLFEAFSINYDLSYLEDKEERNMFCSYMKNYLSLPSICELNDPCYNFLRTDYFRVAYRINRLCNDKYYITDNLPLISRLDRNIEELEKTIEEFNFNYRICYSTYNEILNKTFGNYSDADIINYYKFLKEAMTYSEPINKTEKKNCDNLYLKETICNIIEAKYPNTEYFENFIHFYYISKKYKDICSKLENLDIKASKICEELLKKASNIKEAENILNVLTNLENNEILSKIKLNKLYVLPKIENVNFSLDIPNSSIGKIDYCSRNLEKFNEYEETIEYYNKFLRSFYEDLLDLCYSLENKNNVNYNCIYFEKYNPNKLLYLLNTVYLLQNNTQNYDFVYKYLKDSTKMKLMKYKDSSNYLEKLLNALYSDNKEKLEELYSNLKFLEMNNCSSFRIEEPKSYEDYLFYFQQLLELEDVINNQTEFCFKKLAKIKCYPEFPVIGKYAYSCNLGINFTPVGTFYLKNPGFESVKSRNVEVKDKFLIFKFDKPIINFEFNAIKNLEHDTTFINGDKKYILSIALCNNKYLIPIRDYIKYPQFCKIETYKDGFIYAKCNELNIFEVKCPEYIIFNKNNRTYVYNYENKTLFLKINNETNKIQPMSEKRIRNIKTSISVENEEQEIDEKYLDVYVECVTPAFRYYKLPKPFCFSNRPYRSTELTYKLYLARAREYEDEARDKYARYCKNNFLGKDYCNKARSFIEKGDYISALYYIEAAKESREKLLSFSLEAFFAIFLVSAYFYYKKKQSTEIFEI